MRHGEGKFTANYKPLREPADLGQNVEWAGMGSFGGGACDGARPGGGGCVVVWWRARDAGALLGGCLVDASDDQQHAAYRIPSYQSWQRRMQGSTEARPAWAASRVLEIHRSIAR